MSSKMATQVFNDLADSDGEQDDEMDINPSVATVVMAEQFTNDITSCPVQISQSGFSEDVDRWMRGDTMDTSHHAPQDPVPVMAQGDSAIYGLHIELLYQLVRVPTSLARLCKRPMQPQLPPLPFTEPTSLSTIFYGVWYILAMAFVNLNNRCDPLGLFSSIYRNHSRETAAMGRAWIAGIMSVIRIQILSRADSLFSCMVACWQGARGRLAAGLETPTLMDTFSTGMDLVLLLYVVGFLALSLCQASLIAF